jgi:DNA polymerase-3 subunit alpha
MAAVLAADMDNTDKVVVFIDECNELSLHVRPPLISHSERVFTAPDASTVCFGLGAIKGVGTSAVDAIVEQREADGPYTDLFDFCRRIDGKRVNKRVIEALVRAGALDELGPSRAVLMASIPAAMRVAEQHARDEQAGQNDMFGGAAHASSATNEFVAAREWTDDERLAGEKETLGVYFSGHPIARYESELRHMVSAPLGRLRADPDRTQRVAGLVSAVRTVNSRKGRMAILTLDDRSGRLEVVVYAEIFERCRHLIAKDRLLVICGSVKDDDFSGGCTMLAESVEELVDARQSLADYLLLEVPAAAARNGLVAQLREVLEPFRDGATPVCVRYLGDGAIGRIRLGASWQIRPSDDLLSRLREILGHENHVQLAYHGSEHGSEGPA